jgi:hypothetical protein
MPSPTNELTLSLSPEQRALVACLRVPLGEDEAREVRRHCEGALDWDEVLALATRHRVVALLCWNLQSLGWPGVPAQVRAHLNSAFHIHASHTFALARELVHVSALLAENGIDMVSLKGPTLALSSYGSVALRQFGDLDILVPRSQVLEARRVLLADGYRSRLELARAQEDAHLRDDSVFDLLREKGLDGRPTALELHWALTNRAFARPITFEKVGLRLRREPLVSGTALHLDPADLLLILCVHGTKHLWERLQWVVDVAQLVRRAGQEPNSAHALDWERVRGLAVRFRVERMVALGLLVAHQVLEAPVPPSVLAWARGLPCVEALSAQVRAMMFAPVAESGEATLAASWFLMRAMDSWRSRAHFALHVVTTPPAEERAAIVLPGPLEHLRPLVRASRLASAHLSHARSSRHKRHEDPKP